MLDKAQIACILDRSGSMSTIIADAIGGYNAFLAEQKKISKPADLMVVQFDTEYSVVFDGALHSAPEMNATTYVPRGMTALLDAIGKTVDDIGKKLSALAEDQRPDRVLVVIITDGMENSSTKYSRDKVFDMIKTQRETYKWEFIFLAANQDAIAEAGKIGIASQNAINFAASGQSARASYQVMSSAVSSYRAADLGSLDVMSRALNVDVAEDGSIIKRDVSSSSSSS
jgi:uncharacterized protein YegL